MFLLSTLNIYLTSFSNAFIFNFQQVNIFWEPVPASKHLLKDNGK